MDFPPSYVLSSTLKVGVVYKFSAPEVLGTSVPHYFIVVAVISANNYALVCTTQLDKKIKYVQERNIPEDTICYLEPTKENGLTENTYINCNDYVELPSSLLTKKISEGKLSISGTLSKEEYEKIVNSIDQSPLFDLPREFLTYI